MALNICKRNATAAVERGFLRGSLTRAVAHAPNKREKEEEEEYNPCVCISKSREKRKKKETDFIYFSADFDTNRRRNGI